jgi:putative oxidoreductase
VEVRIMQVARLATRAVVGGLFIGHGTQKLFGWFGGPGREGTEQMMTSLELRPGKHHALAAGASEALGGALVAAGLATPLASSALIGTMITAIRKVHLRNGPWVTNGGYEYNLVLIATLLSLAESGPGELSLDHAFGIERRGLKWALTALALGAAASTAVIEYGRRQGAPDASYPGDTNSRAAEVATSDPAGDPTTAAG